MKERLSLGKIILVVSIAAVVLLTHQAICLSMDLNQDVYGYLDRAKSAPTAEGMNEYIGLALAGLEDYGLTEGNWAWIADRHPDTDMSRSIQQFRDLQVRLVAIENQERGSMHYAKSMEESKDTISEIELSAYSLYTKNHNPLIYPEWYCSLILIIAVGGGFLLTAMFWDTHLIQPSLVCRFKGHNWTDIEGRTMEGTKYKVKECQRCEERVEKPE